MRKRLPGKVTSILSEVRSELEKIYAGRLKNIILFGSYARGDFVDGSDIDLVMILEHVTDPMAERERFFPVICRLCLKYDMVISIILLDANDFRKKRTPLILNVQKEGVRI